MHAAQEIVYAEIGHYDAKERKGDVYMVYKGLAENRKGLGMHYHGVDHEGDECPCLLAVPAPVVAPTHVCPYGAYEDAYAHGGEGRVEEHSTQRLEFFAMRTEGNAHDAADECKRQKGVAHHDNAHMETEKRTV